MPLDDNDLKVVNNLIAEANKPYAQEVEATKNLITEVKQSITELGNSQKSLTESVEALSEAKPAASEKSTSKEKGGGDDAPAQTLTVEQVGEMITKAIGDHTQAQEQSAEQAQATEAWLKKHAPKLAGNEFAQKQFASAKTDEERQTILDGMTSVITSTGVKAPDLGANAEAEGGEKTGDDSPEAQEQAAIQKIRDSKPARL